MSVAPFDPFVALQTLVQHGVRFVVIGGMAARAQGSPMNTRDLDICYDRRADNLTALVAALKTLDARLRGAPEGLPFILDEQTLRLGDAFTFSTTAGPLDCLGTPAGTRGYDDLLANSSELDVEELKVRFASLDDVIRMKRAAGRPQDIAHVEILETLRQS